MCLSIKQINELNAGTCLATELFEQSGKRKFIHVCSYTDTLNGRSSIKDKYNARIKYGLVVYSVLSEVIDYNLEIGSNDIEYHCKITNITEIYQLENYIKEYLEDLSLLQPSWYCDDVL